MTSVTLLETGHTLEVFSGDGGVGSNPWASWAKDAYAINLEGWRALAGCRSAKAAHAVQQRLAKDHFSLLLESNLAISAPLLAMFSAAAADTFSENRQMPADRPELKSANIR